MVASERLAQVSGQLNGSSNADEQAIQRVYAGSSVGKRLDGKIAIITGCDSPIGIGIATARQFAQNGCQALYICDASAKHLDSHAKDLTTSYPDVKIYPRQFDAADEDSVKGIVDEVVKEYGRLDVFFANAGIGGRQKILFELDAKDWAETMRVNTASVFLAVKYASVAMRLTGDKKSKGQGSIIATASVAGLRSGAGSTPYSASKAAVISTMQTSAWQLSGSNIRCNSICPGLIETGMTRITYDAARKKGTTGKIGQLNPTRRGAQSDEVARVALFLASDEASYVNGQAWAVDGGLSAGHPVVPGKIG